MCNKWKIFYILNDINDIMDYNLKSNKKYMYILDDDGFDFYKKSDLDLF